ncbi:MAG: hypothetical protein V8S87_00505 [Oscillospiraceae bacterium]
MKSAHLELWGDNMEHSCSMENDGDIYYVNLTLPEEPQALWYAFYIETDTQRAVALSGRDGLYRQDMLEPRVGLPADGV